MADNVMAAYWALPPVSRNLITATVLTSIGCIVGLLPAMRLIYHPSYLWMFPPQIWRLVTCFLIEMQPINLLFNSFFLYRYSVQLEMGNPRFPRKVDLVFYILFVCTVILCFASSAITVPGNEEDHPCTSDHPSFAFPGWSAVQAWWDVYMDGSCDPQFTRVMIDYLAGLTSFMYMNGLILAMVYTTTQDQRGQKTQYLVLTIPAQALPICMIVVTALMAGPQKALVEIEGLLAAHLFDFLTRIWPEFGNGPRLLRTPAWLERLVQTPRVSARGFGTAVRPGNTPSSGRSTGVNTGPLPDSWRSRGPGQRLG
ncbi:hypothetical protein AU210_006050 [Fusarium oxysporum f. sp. radicis-cucumerinum]|uniref:Derlin n=1 Tax=Fusarium oxysporum f. sp. radicis-cucumerinum TaxID=327505 RepID=A0A2H3HLX9_FUSOX|nr:hypothetical protein AU210_006050 [Fusarium oxysporum f. sp. radicis-cucumerinum]